MPEIVGISGKNKTPTAFTDQSRPKLMIEADSLFNKLAPNANRDLGEVFELLNDTASLIKDTKNYALDDFWTNFEKKVNSGRTLRTKAKSSIEKLMTAFSLFYSGLNAIDANAVSTAEIAEFRAIYQEIQPFVNTKFAGPLTGKDKNLFNRIFSVTSNRLDTIVEAYNTRVENGEIPGAKL